MYSTISNVLQIGVCIARVHPAQHNELTREKIISPMCIVRNRSPKSVNDECAEFYLESFSAENILDYTYTVSGSSYA